jgi:hypothetical protein
MAKKKVSKKKGIDNKNLILGVVVILLLIGVFWYFNNQGVYFQPGDDGMGDDGMGSMDESDEDMDEPEIGEMNAQKLYVKDTDTRPQNDLNSINLKEELETLSCVKVYIDKNCKTPFLDNNGKPVIYSEGDKCQYEEDDPNLKIFKNLKNDKIYEYYSIWGQNIVGHEGSINSDCMPHPMPRFLESCPPCPDDNQEPLCVTEKEFICPGTTTEISAAKCTCVESEVSGESMDGCAKKGEICVPRQGEGSRFTCCEKDNKGNDLKCNAKYTNAQGKCVKA